MNHKIEITVEGMTCGMCATHVETALNSLSEVANVRVPDWKQGTAIVSLEASGGETLDESRVRTAIESGNNYKLTGIRAIAGETPELKSGTNTDPGPEPGPDTDIDLVVIGTGGAGMAGALEAARLGKKVIIVERGTTGGTCVNVGCVPSKAIIKAANYFHLAEHSPFAGVQLVRQSLDWEQLVAAREELVAELRGEKYEKVLQASEGITFKQGAARFVRTKSGYPAVELSTGETLLARRYLIATGAHPHIPDLPGADTVGLLDSTSALFLKQKPESMIVIGGGFIAVELAQSFSRLGVRIESIEARSTLLSAWDLDVSVEVTRLFRAEGIPVTENSLPVSFFQENGQKGVEVRDRDTGAVRRLFADEILIATGRRANIHELNLSAVGVNLDPTGEQIQVDEFMQTSHPAIYAAGDCTTLPKLVYLAAKSGKAAASHAFAGTAVVDLSVVPEVVFADPQIARVGLTEVEARERGLEIIVSKLSMAHVPKAIVSYKKDGFIKLIAETKNNTLIGAHIVSENAGELIQTAAMAIAFGKRYGFTVNDFRDMLFPYLTEVEGLKLASQTFTMDVARLSCCAG